MTTKRNGKSTLVGEPRVSTRPDITRVPIRELTGDAIEGVPLSNYWNMHEHNSELADGEGDSGWESWSAERCEECEDIVVLTTGQGNETHQRTQELAKAACFGHVPKHEGPMMSYWYPLPDKDVAGNDREPEETAKKIVDLPLCVVNVSGVWGLALTGGGMDLSWEIAEAFMRLGYLPPIQCNVPAKMAGRGVSPKDRHIMRACKQSAIVGIRRLRAKLSDLADLRKWSDEYEAERARR